MNRYQNDEKQHKKYKRKNEKIYNNKVPIKKIYTPIQPIIYQPQINTQPHPVYPIAPVYPLMQPIPQPMTPQPARLFVPIGHPQRVVVPIVQPMPINQPVNHKPINKKKKKVIIVRKYPKESGGCCIVF